MFGLGNKRKNEEGYEDAYAYDDYDYEESYDEYDEYGEYNQYEDEHPPRPVRRGRGKENPQSYNDARVEPRAERYEDESIPTKLQELQQEVVRLEENTQRLTAQLEVKQGEMTRLTQLLSDKDTQGQARLQEALKKVEQARDEAAEWKRQARLQEEKVVQSEKEQTQEIRQLNERLRQAEEQARHQEGMKSDLANIIIETKEQGRDIVERAQWEADRIRERAEIDARKIVADASLELRVVKQEASQYRERLTVMKEESNQLFEKLLTSSEQLAQLE